MSVDLDSIGDFDGDSSLFFQPPAPLETFHEALWPNSRDNWTFLKVATHVHHRTDAEERANASFSNALKPKGGTGGGSVSGGVEYHWGDSGEGGGWSGWVQAEAHDDRGNKVEAKAEQNADGSGKVSVSGTSEYNADDGYKDNNSQDRG